MSRRIAMSGLHILLFSFCLASSGLAKSVSSLLAYQDSLGQYSFGYSAPGSARSEVRTSNGETRGAYSYLDDTGVIQSVHYVADGRNGFRVAATNLPQAPLPVQEEQAVLLARTGAVHTEETGQEVSKIGENNVFLKGLQSSERKGDGSNEKNKLQANEGENVIQGAKEGIKLGENENLNGKSNDGSQGEAQSGSSQNGNSSSSELSSNKATLEGLKQPLVPVYRISEGNILAAPFYTKIPINNQAAEQEVNETLNVKQTARAVSQSYVTGLSLTPASTTKISQDAAKQYEKLNEKGLAEQLNEEQGKPRDEIKPAKPYEILLKPTVVRHNPAIFYLPRYTVVPAVRYVVYNNQ